MMTQLICDIHSSDTAYIFYTHSSDTAIVWRHPNYSTYTQNKDAYLKTWDDAEGVNVILVFANSNYMMLRNWVII